MTLPRCKCRAADGASRPPTAAECLGRFWSLAPPALRAAEMRSLQHDQPLSLVCFLPDDREQVRRPDQKPGLGVSENFCFLAPVCATCEMLGTTQFRVEI